MGRRPVQADQLSQLRAPGHRRRRRGGGERAERPAGDDDDPDAWHPLAPLPGDATRRARRIDVWRDELVHVEEGSLYPALYRLEHEGSIASEWGESDNSRRAKYYTLTRDGRRAMKQEAAQWERLSAAISLIVRET